MTSLRIVLVLAVVFTYGTGVSQSCTIVDVSRCYAPLLSKVDLIGYCRALPETKYCIRRLMSGQQCHVYLRGAMQEVLGHLQRFTESSRCRRYYRRPV